jgi:hypothetical protein
MAVSAMSTYDERLKGLIGSTKKSSFVDDLLESSACSVNEWEEQWGSLADEDETKEILDILKPDLNRFSAAKKTWEEVRWSGDYYMDPMYDRDGNHLWKAHCLHCGKDFVGRHKETCKRKIHPHIARNCQDILLKGPIYQDDDPPPF